MLSPIVGRLGACAMLAGLLTGLPRAQSNDELLPAGRKAAAGLRLRLQAVAVEAGKAEPSRFEVVLDNVGEQDLNVKLGYSLANGKSHHPSALRLLVRNPEGKSRTLQFRGTPIAGRVDPYVVPLPVGSRYVLRLKWDQFAEPESGASFVPTGKENGVAVELVGEGVTREEANTDTQGLALVRYWLGTVRSNDLRPSPAAGTNQ